METAILRLSEMERMLVTVILAGSAAFGIAGSFLFLFWRSLERESREGARTLTVRSSLWLVALVLVLVALAVLFLLIEYR
ncbi:MAG TPA: hypothetical protein VM534_08220 [Thermoanaerobaculia bacterium]|nr:hypothetical protein [Thermoanaerobaculia bacterium]